MKILSLVENQTHSGLHTAHGLSLYLETDRHKLLFDLGPDNTLFQNAEERGVDLTKVDTVILSHGHRDHGGALETFLQVNDKATVYVQKRAFLPHISRPDNLEINISLDARLQDHPQIRLLEGDCRIDEELELFTAKSTERCYSYINECLYEDDEQDTFRHEQNLLIHGAKPVLILGCGHSGVVNILDALEGFEPAVCIGGFHLANPDTGVRVNDSLLDELVKELSGFKDTSFYTCHCTGQEAYQYMAQNMKTLHYFACGDEMEI